MQFRGLRPFWSVIVRMSGNRMQREIRGRQYGAILAESTARRVEPVIPWEEPEAPPAPKPRLDPMLLPPEYRGDVLAHFSDDDLDELVALLIARRKRDLVRYNPAMFDRVASGEFDTLQAVTTALELERHRAVA